MDYQKILLGNLKNELPAVILLIIGIVLLVKSLKQLLEFKKSKKMINHKKERIYLFYLFIYNFNYTDNTFYNKFRNNIYADDLGLLL